MCDTTSSNLTMDDEVSGLFNKKFTFERTEEWFLPPLDVLNEEKLWNIDYLMKLKEHLNTTKSLLNDKGNDWHRHTAHINKAGLVKDVVKKTIKPEILTQAWCKFYEILSSFPLISTDTDVFRTVHLCEAPGAFISALNYHLCKWYPNVMWEWLANSLNPYYEGHCVKTAVVDDRLLFQTIKKWHFGSDNTGNIMSSTYLTDISTFLGKERLVHLVTADGSISCVENPGEQELIVADLQFSEVLVALHVLEVGGCFVVKKFTLFECISVCTMYLLNCVFEKVHVFKPVTSKAGNSEVYVVCLGYLGIQNIMPYSLHLIKNISLMNLALFPQSYIPHSFITQLENCCKMFADYQMSSIKENVELFSCMTLEKRKYIDEVKEACAEMYFKIYALDPLDPEDYFKLCSKKKKVIKTSYGNECKDLQMLFYTAMGSTFDSMKMMEDMSWEHRLLDFQNRLDQCFPINKKRPIDSISWHPVWREMSRNMKRSCYQTWITLGGKIDCIRNSKFCNPLILLLWDEITQKNEVSPENHTGMSFSQWDWECLESLVSKCKKLSNSEILLFVEINNSCDNNIVKGVKSVFKEDIEVHYCAESHLAQNYHNCKKVVVIDTISWSVNSFQQELFIKHRLVNTICNVIKALNNGDSVIIHIQTLLTRFTVGILFIFLSMFAQTATLLPLSTAAASCGQLWVLADYQCPVWTKIVLKYLNDILAVKEQEAIEVVPITALCGGQFYEYLLNNNNQFMLQRLRKIISIEQIRLRKNKQTGLDTISS